MCIIENLYGERKFKMNQKQKLAIRLKKEELLENLQPIVDLFLVTLRFRKIINEEEEEVQLAQSKSDRERLSIVLQTLESKDKGWEVLTEFLTENNLSKLANSLHNTIEEDSADLLSKFSDDLAQYYKRTFGQIPNLRFSEMNMEHVRTSIKVENNAGDLTVQKGDRFSHTELLQLLRKNTTTNMAVIAGEPGMGKSTFMNKIAFEWADKFLGDQMLSYCFDLVLLVPLRLAKGKSDSFLQLALNYLVKILKPYADQVVELANDISRLRSRVLICLDGLDEYADFAISPFKSMFAPPFRYKQERIIQLPLPHFVYKVLITSRTYACEQIREDFHPLRLTMSVPDSKNQIEQFVEIYCEKEKVVKQVVNFVKNEVDQHGNEILAVPLILAFICNMANSSKNIPNSLTLLYESFTKEMLLREERDGKLKGTIDTKNWTQSQVVKTTAAMAFWGCTEKKPVEEFTEEEMNRFEVGRDSFSCGFLFPKYSFKEQCLKADFGHLFLQQFFAGIHCYNRMLAGDDTLKKVVILNICKSQSRLCRFFFGLCANAKQFSTLLDWIGSVLETCSFLLDTAIDQLLISLSQSLADCPPDESRQMFKKWLSLFYKFGDKITAKRDVICWPFGIPLKKLQRHTKTSLEDFGVKIQEKTLGRQTFYDWQIGSLSLNHVPMIVVSEEPKEELWSNSSTSTKSKKIDVFVWLMSEALAKDISKYLNRLPPVTTLVIRTNRRCNCEINFHVHGEKAASQEDLMVKLSHVSFGFAKSQFDELYASFAAWQTAGVSMLSFYNYKVSGDKCKIVWIDAKVKRNLSQEELIKSLIYSCFVDRLFYEGSRQTKKDCTIS